MKIHLDTDIGGDLDDVCALALLLSMPEVEITGVTIETIGLSLLAEDGWVRVCADPDGGPFRVVTAVDAMRFAAFWLDALTSGAAQA
jgi:hypothetical protein